MEVGLIDVLNAIMLIYRCSSRAGGARVLPFERAEMDCKTGGITLFKKKKTHFNNKFVQKCFYSFDV